MLPWAATIEKAIAEADLGVSASTDDQGLRVSFPELTAERRGLLMKLANEKLEDARVTLRGRHDDVHLAVGLMGEAIDVARRLQAAGIDPGDAAALPDFLERQVEFTYIGGAELAEHLGVTAPYSVSLGDGLSATGLRMLKLAETLSAIEQRLQRGAVLAYCGSSGRSPRWRRSSGGCARKATTPAGNARPTRATIRWLGRK